MTGAPRLLVHFLEHFKQKHPEAALDIVIQHSGPLLEAFSKIGRTLVMHEDEAQDIPSRIARKIRNLLLKETREDRLTKRLRQFLKRKYALVFVNTIACGDTAKRLPVFGVPVLTYVHELERSIHYHDHGQTVRWQLEHSDYFIVPSLAVKDNLVRNHGIASGKILDLPYLIPGLNSASQKRVSGTLRVGSCGTLDWRKGADAFLQVAIRHRKQYPGDRIQWVWIGAHEHAPAFGLIREDIQAASLQDCVELLPPSDDAPRLIGGLDVFLLTSREDPYPLVILEAAMQRVPVICFEHSGGAPEFVKGNGGEVVPYLDVAAMSDSLHHMLTDAAHRHQLGEAGYRAYAEKHSPGQALPVFERILEKAIA
jgi:glycosyltransferase involved in cell wall biosynthesis